MDRFMQRLINRVIKTKIDRYKDRLALSQIDREIDRLMNKLDIYVDRYIFENFDISKFRVKLLDEVQERYSTQCLGDECCGAQLRKDIQHNVEKISVAETTLGKIFNTLS